MKDIQRDLFTLTLLILFFILITYSDKSQSQSKINLNLSEDTKLVILPEGYTLKLFNAKFNTTNIDIYKLDCNNNIDVNTIICNLHEIKK